MGARLRTLLPFSFSMEDTNLMRKEDSLSVVQLVLESGERLPCLVETATWLPVRLVTRWAVRHRRYQVQASTLRSDLYALKKLYQWAEMVVGMDVDDYLLSDRRLTARHLESLASRLREDLAGNGTGIPNPSTYNKHLLVWEAFLKWALYPENRGGQTELTFGELAAERAQLSYLFRSLRARGRSGRRILPLSHGEVETIRVAIGPRQSQDGNWQFTESPFSAHTALRNWLMFETALELGLRRGELLKLRLDSLPRGAEQGIRVRRFPDDPHDSRNVEPAVKTAERVVPASRNLLSAIRHYVTTPPPEGRVPGKTPYLFVARQGAPLSTAMADDIIRAIGRHSGVESLSWHRLRHAWAEQMAERLSEQPNGMDVLMYLGGWTSHDSVRHYIQNTITRQAHAAMRRYHDTLYETPVASEERANE
jgi:integrase